MAYETAHAKAKIDSGSNPLIPGLKIIKIPINPKKIVSILCQSTFSSKNMIDKAVTIIGPIAKIAEVSINPNFKKQ